MAIAAKIFDAQDQVRFAVLTGDSNPMHTDSNFARRTQAGAPVVHGVHALLWLLDAVAAHHSEIANIATLKVRFRKMVYVGERVEARISRLSPGKLQAQATIDGLEVVSVSASFGTAVAVQPTPPDGQDELLVRRIAPHELGLEDIEGRSGRVQFAAEAVEMQRAFPNAAKLLGVRRVAALGCSSYLIGMVVPGLHSMYVSLDLNTTDDCRAKDELRYAVTSVDPRFRRVAIAISGGGFSGTLGAAIRAAPVSQAAIERLAKLVNRTEFSASTALVIGGSRGLGEFTAKLLAAGGSDVIITYATGKIEANNVAAEINRWGGRCEAIHYDIHRHAHEQLQSLRRQPTHLYYFATPTILRRKASLFAPTRFGELNAFFVEGFFKLVEAALNLRPEGIVAFYPSSQFVVDRPAEMTEYAMSKAAAEVLCADIGNYLPGARIVVERLPRLRTDQTAALDAAELEDPLSVILPIVRRMHMPTSQC
jgi:acyl dehydratase/NAD(P)-dependent dehydrogenase (short-subunit alcohol dehydrogenase family)